MPDPSTTNWQRPLWRRLRAEPKKMTALGVLVLVMAVLWGRALLTGKSQPAAALASPAMAAGKTDPSTVASSLSPAAQALQELMRNNASLLHRNLFLVKLDYFASEKSSVAPAANATDGFWDELAKSLAAKADQEKARRILADNLQAQAAKLDLQSTYMNNGARKAMVNGTLVGEGDSIGGFRVIKIEAKRIIVEREGIKLEIVFRS